MPWVKFDRDYDWFPPEMRRVWHQAYRSGNVALLTRRAAAEAVGKERARLATEEEIANARRRA